MAAGNSGAESTLQDSRAGTVYAGSIASLVISTVFFIGRVYSLRLQRLSVKASEYVLLFGLCCCWGLSIVNICLTTLGLGMHFEQVQREDPTLGQTKKMLKIFIVAEVFYDLGISAIKISILLFYRRIFAERTFRRTTTVLMVIAGLWGISNLIPSIFSCRPISGWWDLTMDPPPVCIDKNAFYIAGSTTNIVLDIIILCLPVRKVLQLQLDLRAKIAISFAFLLGGLVCIISAYRFSIFFTGDSADLTWYFARLLNWTAIELAVGVASACLPTMRPLFKAVLSLCRRSSDTTGSTAQPRTSVADAPRSKTAHTHNSSISTFTTSTECDKTFNHQCLDNEVKQDDRITVTRTFELSTIQKRDDSEDTIRGTDLFSV